MADPDLTEIEAFARRTGQRCTIDTLLNGESWKGASLSESDRAMLRDALPQGARFSSATLSKWLKSKGVALGDSAIARHRNGGCLCERS